MPGYEFFGDEERKEIDDVMNTGVLMRYGFDAQRKGNWKAKELEEEICNTFGCKYAQLTSSGTSALTTALAALGIGFGDEVIMPAFTFVASFEAVISVGAIPVLVDIDESLNDFLNKQSEQLQQQLQKYSNEPFEASDAIMGRCISTAISLAWTEEQINEKGERITAVVKKVLRDKYVSV